MANQNSANTTSPTPDSGLFLLPTRGEKRIIPMGFVSGSEDITPDDFEITAALRPFVQTVQVRIPGRGVTAQGQPDPSAPAVFQFLVNPSQLQVSRQQLDAQAMSRAGWQIGVWGEDFIQVTMEGKAPGRYFAGGLTDEFADLTMSFRHLSALEVLVENNGYWFEGEQAGEGPLAAGFTRRQIKMHQDVELAFGEFHWFGMFEALNIHEDAQTPYLQSFNLTFIAWREAFTQGTPYPNPISGAVQRGHIPNAYLAYRSSNPGAVATKLSTQPSALSTLSGSAPPLPNNVDSQSASLLSINSLIPYLPANDVTPVSEIMNPQSEWVNP